MTHLGQSDSRCGRFSSNPAEACWPLADYMKLREVAAEMAATMRDVLAIVDTQPDYPWQGGALKQQMREDITSYELLGLDAKVGS